MAASDSIKTAGCEQVLTELLALIEPDEAVAIACRLVRHFGSVGSVLAASSEARGGLLVDAPLAALQLELVNRTLYHVLHSPITDRPILATLSAVLDYLSVHIGFDIAERVIVLYLNSAGLLIADETAATGSIRHTPLYPREIVRRALELGAASIILAHNHPGGDITPSANDLAATRLIAEAARLFDITLFDHLIVSRSRWTSFRSEGLL